MEYGCKKSRKNPLPPPPRRVGWPLGPGAFAYGPFWKGWSPFTSKFLPVVHPVCEMCTTVDVGWT